MFFCIDYDLQMGEDNTTEILFVRYITVRPRNRIIFVGLKPVLGNTEIYNIVLQTIFH